MPDTTASSSTPLACTLTSPQLQQRKATVLSELRRDMQERRELPDGYAFRFDAADATLDRLHDFIQYERACCSFFTFRLTITSDTAWLELTGPEGAKDFIQLEMGL